MPTTVTPELIATAMGRPFADVDATTVDQWAMWISDADMLIDARIEALTATEPNQMARDYVVREAVVAHVRRPDEATQVTVTANDASVSKTYQRSTGRVKILDEWWVLLGLQARGGAFSIDTAGALGISAHAPWCDLWFGGATCSCGVDLAGYPIFGVFDWYGEGGDDW